MRMSRVHTPPIVDQHVKHTQKSDEEHCRVLCFEPNRDHDTCEKSDNADYNATQSPGIALETQTKEEEDKEYSSSELEICSIR